MKSLLSLLRELPTRSSHTARHKFESPLLDGPNGNGRRAEPFSACLVMAHAAISVATPRPSRRVGLRTKWLAASAIAQLVLALYFQAINWLPMGSWNYQPGSEPLTQQLADGSIGIPEVVYVALFLLPVTLFLIAMSRNWAWLMWSGLVGYTVWLVLQIMTWWLPYAFGASDRWMATYHRVFSQSTQLLPTVGRHLAPDGLHILLSLLLVVVVITTAAGLVRLAHQGRHSQPHPGLPARGQEQE